MRKLGYRRTLFVNGFGLIGGHFGVISDDVGFHFIHTLVRFGHQNVRIRGLAGAAPPS